MRKTRRTQSGVLSGRAGARRDGGCPPTPPNYSADAGAGSNTITVKGESAGWRGALLGTVAAGALLLYSARSARAGPDGCDLSGASPNQTATCQGDQSDGIASGTDFIAADVSTLIVNNLNTDIAPGVANVDGIYFVRAGAGFTITIISNTEPFDIIATGTGDGIFAHADGTIVIDHTGDIDAGDYGIFARTYANAVDLSITTTGTVTGGNYGIGALNLGGGAVDIVANGAVEGTVLTGIYARNDGTDLSIESEAVTGGYYGIRARNFGSGALDITANGDVEGADRSGIYAYNSANSNFGITIETEGVTGGNRGIDARNYGDGAIDIVANGAVVGTNIYGIYARNYGTDLSIESVGVAGGNFGIHARNLGSGEVDIVANGAIEGTGANSFGIYARNNGTDLTIETAGVTGGTSGIYARNFGSGAFDIIANGDVEGTNTTGINAYNSGNSTEGLSIETQAVTDGTFGIRARNFGSGAVDIVAEGDVEGTGANSRGIYAYNSAASAEGISIESAAVTGGITGIRAFNYGDGALDIVANGDVQGTGANSIGIFARNNGTSASIQTETVTGGNYGIRALNYGSGALDIVANGAVEGTNSIGIYAYNSGNSDEGILIETAAVTGGDYGIRALNNGSGAVSIVANGDVEGTNVTGILARNYANSTGGISIESAAVTGFNYGIRAQNLGGGALEIVANGDVEGTGANGAGIYAVNSANSLEGLTIEAASVTGGNRGIDARNAGSEGLEIVATGTVEGTDNIGIYARNEGTDLSIESASVTGGNHGIYAFNQGDGTLSIVANGDVIGEVGTGIVATNGATANGLSVTVEAASYVYGYFNAIAATNNGGGSLEIEVNGSVRSLLVSGIAAQNGNTGEDLIVTTGAGSLIEGAVSGIDANNFGIGALRIESNGNVSSSDGAGIFARNGDDITSAGTNLTVITGAGTTVTGYSSGIDAHNYGTGAIDIAVRGDVTGNTNDGIFAQHGTGGPIRIIVDAGVTSNGADADDFAIQTEGGAADVTVEGTLNGGAGGAVAFDQIAALDDRLALVNGAVVNGNAFGGPGTDTLALEGGGTGQFDVSHLIDFEAGEKTGNGHWVLDGTNTQIANFTVEDGLLTVDGNLQNAAFDVTGGSLGGTGIVGPTTVAAGGILAPGDSIGTFTVNGVFTLQAGAIYEVEVNAAGQGDKVIVTGTVNLSGAVLRVLATNGNYKPRTDYVIVENDGNDAVNGEFAEITTNLAFLTPTVIYDGGSGNDVVLFLTRNDSDFCAVARTRNQCAVGRALDQFPTDDPLFLAVLNQTEAGARQAFDALSGEIHATLPGILADDSRYVRDAVLGRLVQATYTNNAGQLAALGAGGPQVASLNTGSLDAQAMALGYDGKHLAAPPPRSGAAFWTRGYGAWGDFEGDGNAASADRDLGGFISGIDTQISGTWRAGLAAGGSWSNISVGDRHSHAEVESFQLAGYAGGMAGPLALRGGGAWAWQDIDTDRAVMFPGFFERQSTSYDADTGQIFGEVAYPVAAGRVAFEPFAGLAYVSVETDSFRERGGALASLNGGSDDEDVGYSTLGLRAATAMHWNTMLVIPKISAAWQHAFDDVTPGASLAFATTSIGFGIDGVPLAQDSLLLEAGLDFSISATATLGVSYSGQFADDVTDNGVKGRLTWLF